MKRTRKALRAAVAVALPLALVGGSALTVPWATPAPQGRAWSGRWLTSTGSTKGIAPGVQLTSLKLGTANGAVDVSQVIAAVDWVVEHRNDDPANPTRT